MPRSPHPRSKRRAERETPACPLPERAGVCVVGAGASGLAAALAAAGTGADVCILEAGPRPGKPILASGNGRCNLTNEALGATWAPNARTPFVSGPGAPAPDREPGPAWDLYSDPSFARAVMGADPLADIRSLFRALGVLCLPDDEGRIYPASRCASSVLAPLLAGLEHVGAPIITRARVTELTRTGSRTWDLCLDDGRRVTAEAVVWAAGGGSAHALARACGAHVTPEEPVLAPLAVRGGASELDGVRATCVASLVRRQRGGLPALMARERGEVLFRPYGVSGIVVFDLSRLARAGDVLSLDVTPGAGAEPACAAELLELVRSQLEAAHGSADAGPRRLAALDGVLNPALGHRVMASLCGADGTLETDAASVARALAHLEFVVEGVADATHAQVTRGGLENGEVDPATMAVRRAEALYACGEALDMDAACGGFNLSWAWLSGIRAGRHAARGI